MGRKISRICTVSIVVLVIAVLIVSTGLFTNLIAYDRQNYSIGESLQHLAIEGEYSEEGSPWKPLTADTSFDNWELRDITIRGHFTRDLPEKSQLFLKIDQVWVSLKVNGEQVYYCGPKEGDGNLTQALGRQWASFTSPGITTSDEVELRFGNIYPNAHLIQFDSLLDNMHTGDSSELLSHALREDGWDLGICAVFLCLAVVLLLAGIFCAPLRIKGTVQFLILGCVAFFAAAWFGTLTPSITLFVPLPVFLNVLYAYSMQGMVVFLVFFFAKSLSGARRNAMLVTAGVLLLALFVDLLRQVYSVQDLYDAINHFSILDVCAVVVLLAALFYKVNAPDGTQAKAHAKIMVPLLICGVLELINGYVQFFQAAVFLGVGLISFVLLESIWLVRRIQQSIHNEKRIAKLESDLAQSRISMMLSQIQPHFLYNALMGIKQLCDTNPGKASDALEHFSFYLRGNLDSLTQDQQISFEKELEHVEDYLYLEKMRFDERLSINWEIATKNFVIPPLTLQPIVENAVRHGITKKEEGGTVTVRSEETAEGVFIYILDDGIGFDMEMPLETSRSHVGLDNVRKRLEVQCGGQLQIESQPGKGTKVTIFLPRQDKTI